MWVRKRSCTITVTQVCMCDCMIKYYTIFFLCLNFSLFGFHSPLILSCSSKDNLRARLKKQVRVKHRHLLAPRWLFIICERLSAALLITGWDFNKKQANQTSVWSLSVQHFREVESVLVYLKLTICYKTNVQHPHLQEKLWCSNNL